MKPINPLQVPRFGGIATFSRLPWFPEPKAGELDVAILGVPYDGGTTFRPGARFGPRALRDASVLNRNYNPDLKTHVYERLRVGDVGDVATNPLSFTKTLSAIQSRVADLLKRGCRTVALGGDHSILLGELRAYAAHTRGKGKGPSPLTLIHFDAHTDTADGAWGEKYHHGTPIRRAIEEGLVQGSRIFQIGIRGPLTSPDQMDFDREHGIRQLEMSDFHDDPKRRAFLAQLRRTAGRGPCFITFDVDGVDPAFAPGTGTPVVGGLTSVEALRTVRELRGLDIVGADLVEVAPAYDHAELTSLLGAALVFEFLTLMAIKPGRG